MNLLYHRQASQSRILISSIQKKNIINVREDFLQPWLGVKMCQDELYAAIRCHGLIIRCINICFSYEERQNGEKMMSKIWMLKEYKGQLVQDCLAIQVPAGL